MTILMAVWEQEEILIFILHFLCEYFPTADN